jgi:hypothetical protein
MERSCFEPFQVSFHLLPSSCTYIFLPLACVSMVPGVGWLWPPDRNSAPLFPSVTSFPFCLESGLAQLSGKRSKCLVVCGGKSNFSNKEGRETDCRPGNTLCVYVIYTISDFFHLMEIQ